MRGDHHLSATIICQAEQLGKEPPVEDRRVAAMVAVARNDDPSRRKCADQFRNRVPGEVRLITHCNQGSLGRIGQEAEPDPDRPADSKLGGGVGHQAKWQARERIRVTLVIRNHHHDRLEAGVHQVTRRATHQRLTVPRLEQFLAWCEPARLAGGEENPPDQLAGVAAFSCCSTQLANRCVIR